MTRSEVGGILLTFLGRGISVIRVVILEAAVPLATPNSP